MIVLFNFLKNKKRRKINYPGFQWNSRQNQGWQILRWIYQSLVVEPVLLKKNLRWNSLSLIPPILPMQEGLMSKKVVETTLIHVRDITIASLTFGSFFMVVILYRGWEWWEKILYLEPHGSHGSCVIHSVIFGWRRKFS